MLVVDNHSTALAIFVKTPGLSPVKTRLAATIGQNNAEKFYRAAVAATAEMTTNLAETITPYWAITEPHGMKHSMWQNFSTICSDSGDDNQNLGHRLAHVYNNLIKYHKVVIIIGSDSPQIEAQLINGVEQSFLNNKEQEQCFFGPSVDGGFYLFAGNAPVPDELWQQCEYSCESTYADLKHAFSKQFSRLVELPILQDVDTLTDLQALENQLRNKTHADSLQQPDHHQGLLKILEEIL